MTLSSARKPELGLHFVGDRASDTRRHTSSDRRANDCRIRLHVDLRIPDLDLVLRDRRERASQLFGLVSRERRVDLKDSVDVERAVRGLVPSQRVAHGILVCPATTAYFEEAPQSARALAVRWRGVGATGTFSEQQPRRQSVLPCSPRRAVHR